MSGEPGEPEEPGEPGHLNETIDRVHKYIELCIMHHMTKSETIDCIASQTNIPHAFTQTIWEQLEIENEEFFRAYHLRLAVRDQIVRFNRALSMQAQLMVHHHHHHQPQPLNKHHHHQINANHCWLQRASQQQGLIPNGHPQHNGNHNGLQQPRPNGSQQQGLNVHQQRNGNHNGLQQPRPNGSQQQGLNVHQQHNGNHNGLQQPRPNGSHQLRVNGNHNGLQQPHSNGSHQHHVNGNHNGLQQPRFNAAMQQVLYGNPLQRRSGRSQQQLHQHNIASNASHVASTTNAAQLGRGAMQQQQLNSRASSTRSNLQSHAGTPTSHFSSSSNFPESASPMGDQTESSSAQNPIDFIVDPEEAESGDGSTNRSS